MHWSQVKEYSKKGVFVRMYICNIPGDVTVAAMESLPWNICPQLLSFCYANILLESFALKPCSYKVTMEATVAPKGEHVR